jgi:YbbR domain-containing protein
MAGSMADAASLTLHCNPVADVDPTAAKALCDAFADALATSQWANVGGVTLQLDVNTLRPAAINVTLNVTGPNGRAHTINRALSASDTTITPAMQVTFLQKLISAIPPDF